MTEDTPRVSGQEADFYQPKPRAAQSIGHPRIAKRVDKPDGSRGKRRVYKRINDEEKMNPNCLRWVLFELVNFRYERNWRWAARDLFDKQVRYDAKFSDDLGPLSGDRNYFTYWHLEAFANVLRIPTGLLLLFAQHQSNCAKFRPDANLRLFSDMEEIATTIPFDGPISVATMISIGKPHYMSERETKGGVEFDETRLFHTVFHERENMGRKKKLNPDSLRRMFFDIIQEYYDGDLVEAAHDLNNRQRLYRLNSQSRSKFTPQMIEKILTDTMYISYWHLEAFSSKLGVPIGVFLLVSRMCSNISKDCPELNKGVLESLLSFSYWHPSISEVQFKDIVAYSGFFDAGEFPY